MILQRFVFGIDAQLATGARFDLAYPLLADAEAFAAYNGTVSLPFTPGENKRIAVKVIDPRGNEVIAIRNLEGGA